VWDALWFVVMCGVAPSHGVVVIGVAPSQVWCCTKYGCGALWSVWSCVVLHQDLRNTAGGALTSRNGFQAKVLEVSKDYKTGKAVT
jgi:hypothetical protein